MNVKSLKAVKTESPKTPGGISKSLLTPCRRLGLSRNWKKVGPSPFVSPLSSTNSSSTEIKTVKEETRKRKVRTPTEDLDECIANSPKTALENETVDSDVVEKCSDLHEDISITPSRHVEIPRRKKSKTLVSTLRKKTSSNAAVPNSPLALNNVPQLQLPTSLDLEEKAVPEKIKIIVSSETVPQTEESIINQKVSTVVETKSKMEFTKALERKENTIKLTPEVICSGIQNVTPGNTEYNECTEPDDVQYEVKKRSPNDLTKECIVVIQKKIFKTDKKIKPKKPRDKENAASVSKTKDTVSQTLFDSDSDEPLCQLNKKDKEKRELEIIHVDDDLDFVETTVPIKKLVDKNTSVTGLKPRNKKKLNKTKANPQKIVQVLSKHTEANLSNSFEDDDFDMDRRTILIRKTYDKVTKPQKAKSTGSITQQDIDDLKARIETKKKMLMAKAMSGETEELRTLIKKWQKGCQDALMELMDLMRDKLPERQNMDYAEMLETLKIPAMLVGYDEDHDCFITPDDQNIVLAKFKDL